MKVLLYTESAKALEKSGLGKAIEHQKEALETNNIEYTTDKKELENCDLVDINFLDPKVIY